MISKKYQRVFNTIQEYAHVYNYDYACDNICEDNYYKIFNVDHLANDGKCEFRFISYGSNDERLMIEQINVTTIILKELGLDVIINLNASYKNLSDYLNYLDADYEICDIKDSHVICEYLINDTDIGKSLMIDNSYETDIDINVLIDEMDDLKDKDIDAYLICSSKEEKLKASIVINDLRLSGIVCDMCYLNLDKDKQIEYGKNARNLIIFDDENLQKGLINVQDNITGERVNVPEDEIIDYMLGVI